jgi:hypothetical protein
MIVIGVDVHKASLTAVAVDEVGREVGEQTSKPSARSSTAPSSMYARSYGVKSGPAK